MELLVKKIVITIYILKMIKYKKMCVITCKTFM